MLHRGLAAFVLLAVGGATACNSLTGVDNLGVENGGASAGGASTTGGHGAGTGTGGTSQGSSTSSGTSGNASSGHSSSGGASSGGTSSGAASSSGTSTSSTSSSSTSSSSSSSTSSGTTGDQEPPDMVGMTAAHNAARAAVMPAASPALPPMAWSSSIAAVAQAFTDNCVFADDTSSGNGSNAFAGTGTYTPADVVNAWVSEDADYDYATNSCAAGKECGHYTQVVWRDSVELGCGLTNCTKNNPFGSSGSWVLVVCEYSPPGNYVGEKPY